MYKTTITHEKERKDAIWQIIEGSISCPKSSDPSYVVSYYLNWITILLGQLVDPSLIYEDDIKAIILSYKLKRKKGYSLDWHTKKLLKLFF